MQPLLGSNRETAFFGHRDEISEMPELHGTIPEKYGGEPTKSFSRAPVRPTSFATAAAMQRFDSAALDNGAATESPNRHGRAAFKGEVT
jgi:hypothetical protein